MLSHQPEVSRLLHEEHVERLADDARQPLHRRRRSSIERSRLLSRLAVAPAPIDVRYPGVPSRS